MRHQDGGRRWRTKIGVPPADGCPYWRRVALRSKAVLHWQVLLAGEADALRQQARQCHASHPVHAEMRRRQVPTSRAHVAHRRWPHRIDGATRRSKGLQVPRISIAGRTPVQDRLRKESPHFFRNWCGVAVDRAAAVRFLNSCSYSLSRRSHSQATSAVSAFSKFA